MDNNINIIKQLVEVTQNRVIFTGSFTDVVRGLVKSYRDLDIIIRQKDLKNLKVFGEIVHLEDTTMFIGQKRYFIKNNNILIDIFIMNDFSNLTFEILLFKDIPIKTYTIESQITQLEKFSKLATKKGYELKFLKRATKLKTLLTIK